MVFWCQELLLQKGEGDNYNHFNFIQGESIMEKKPVILLLEEAVPFNVFEAFEIEPTDKAGLIIVDEVNGFCKPGAGILAPPARDEEIEKMINHTNNLAHIFVDAKYPILTLLDTHEAGRPERPFPPHCIEGTGEELIVEPLKWLNNYGLTKVVKKDCFNGFVGAINKVGENALVKWVNDNQLDVIVVVGICTDICVLQLVQTMLSARNHDIMPTLREVVVYTEGCATYDLPKEVAIKIRLPETQAHPRDIMQYAGFLLMAQSGALLAKKITLTKEG